MPNTTDNFDIPFLDGTELVRDYPTFSEDLANAVDNGLSNVGGGLVAVKDVLKTNAFVSGSISAGQNVAVPGLSITHEVQDPANRLIISAFFGSAANSEGRGQTGIAIHDGTNLIGIADAAGSRTRVSAGGITARTSAGQIVTMPSISFVHTPGAGSKTYTVRAINIRESTQTLFVNRAQSDEDNASLHRAVSGIVIQEVAV